MIVIWKGAGGLVALIWFGCVLAGGPLTDAVFGADASNALSNLVGEWLAAALTLGLAIALRYLGARDAGPAEGTGGGSVMDHTLFFIPVVAWPAIFFALGIVTYGAAPPGTPPVLELTPRAAQRATQMAAAGPAPRDWHLRIEVEWPEAEGSPQYKLSIVSGRPGAADVTFRSQGVRVLVPKGQVFLLRGARVDYGGNNGEDDFIVTNPNLERGLAEK
jgi:Fe-S cluster assembly iron-binding protein IscA